jgi:hypothetical protein
MTNEGIAVAEKLKKLLIESSPLIEEYTSVVCPDCRDVCCMQKHGRYWKGDAAYLNALGCKVPHRDESRSLEGPCESMGPRGCDQPRWLRPLKCTSYFCEPLIKALNNGPSRKSRRLSSLLQEMADLYRELVPE